MMSPPPRPSLPPFPCSFGPASSVAADWLAVPLFEGEPAGAFESDPLLDAEVRRAREATRFIPRRYESVLLGTSGGGLKAAALLLLGAGPEAEFTPDVARRLASAASLVAKGRGIGKVAVLHRVPASAAAASIEAWAEAWAEGATLAEFDPGRYKTTEPERRLPPGLLLAWPEPGEGEPPTIEAAAARGRLVAACANLARQLINEPGNLLPPRLLAERAAAMAEGTGLRVEVLDERKIAELGMGLLAGVARGSHEPPCLIVIEHSPRAAAAGPVLALVGKGVTFDSGGISIKTSAGMDRMKDDMAGGAAVIASLRAIALLELPIRVVGVVPAVENMPSGNAVKPGDVLHAASGRTVEVIDTDAEGRLILGDALWYAQQRGATHLVDLATLTGACTVALGKTTTGLFGRPDDWAERVWSLAEKLGERCWRLPLVDEYRELLKSEIADTSNVGGRHGGAITAALFLEAFAGDLPWVHLDIAGTAWNDEARPYMPKGPTGVGVRTMTALAAELAAAGRG